jgi:hypothetical protein
MFMPPSLGHDEARDSSTRHRLAVIRHTIPDRLDSAARLLDDALDLVARHGLAEALQPDPVPYQATVEGLRAAARRIRTAAEAIPVPGWSSRSAPDTSRPQRQPELLTQPAASAEATPTREGT